MAHRIVYTPPGIVLSSAIGEIVVDVDGSFVDVTLTGPGNIAVLTERYYAYGGRVTLYDLASLIEAEMRSSGQSYADFTLRVFTDTPTNKADSRVLHVLYCDRFTVCTDVPAFLRENFLTTLSMRRVATGSTTSLFLYAEKGRASSTLSRTLSIRKIPPPSIIISSLATSARLPPPQASCNSIFRFHPS